MNKIKPLRQAAGLTQQALSEMVGVHVRILQRWEGGTGKPSADNLIKLSTILKCEPAALLSEKECEMVRELKKDGNYWSWVLEDEPKYLYFTNDDGSGIFCQKRSERETNLANEFEVKQITGTCQFSLFGYSISGARKKIKRFFEFE